MNKQGEIETIRQACIKANPEIMELKFGCRILAGGLLSDTGFIIRPYTEFGNEKENKYLYWNDSINEARILREKDFEILGREIRLADVLLALDKKFGMKYGEIRSVGISNGIFKWCKLRNGADEAFENLVWSERWGKNGKMYFWDLLHDNLELQSKETINFLAELLK